MIRVVLFFIFLLNICNQLVAQRTDALSVRFTVGRSVRYSTSREYLLTSMSDHAEIWRSKYRWPKYSSHRYALGEWYGQKLRGGKWGGHVCSLIDTLQVGFYKGPNHGDFHLKQLPNSKEVYLDFLLVMDSSATLWLLNAVLDSNGFPKPVVINTDFSQCQKDVLQVHYD